LRIASAAIGGIAMTYRQFPHAMDRTALKWRDLAERRRAYFVELYRSGRYKHYYTDQEFAAQLRQAIKAAERWAEIAPRPEDFRRAAE
jgi:hypothetical protein